MRGVVELPDFIRLANQEPHLRFLVIGGYAVAAHGYSRATFDVDFIVPRASREAWLNRLTDADLKLLSQTNAFAQFGQAGKGDGLDLMFVDDDTFNRMREAAEEHDFDGVRARVPCLDHLLALKLHALKQALRHRTARDAEDVEQLLRIHQVDLRQPKYQELFKKYATQEIYETFLRTMRDA